MSPSMLGHEIYSSFAATLVLVAPLLIVAIILGILLGLVQAVTQIQDQALPQMIKIMLLSVLVMAFGAWLATPLYEHTLRVFTQFPALVR